MKPRVILFDEPLSYLDAKLRHRVRAEIRALQQRLGLTAVYVTHDQEEALAISDRVVVMNAGRIEQQGTPRELYQTPATHFVADFIGSANIVPGHYADGLVHLGEARIAHQQDIASGPVDVVILPETVRPAAQGQCATVKAMSFLGAVTEVGFDTPIGEITANLPDEALSGLHAGADVRLSFDGRGLHLLPRRQQLS
jgi:iron(III) transport system ATP-binding protein